MQMSDLKQNTWIQGTQMMPQTPLMTPDVLSASDAAERGLQTTFNAFHKAQREGFRLQDVVSAKLAQRRRNKKSSSDNNSSSSSFTSEGSSKSTPTTPLTTKPAVLLDLKRNEYQPDHKFNSSSSDKKENVFCFGDYRVKQYLRTMSSSSPDICNSPSTSVSERTSNQTVRESTSSSGIVVSDKNSVDTNENITRKKRIPKKYEKTRQSERIRRKHRGEIDLDPICFTSLPHATRKRKFCEENTTQVLESPQVKIRKQAVVAASRKIRRKYR